MPEQPDGLFLEVLGMTIDIYMLLIGSRFLHLCLPG